MPSRPILVTGAAGFIGAHVAARLRARGHSVVGCDNFSLSEFASPALTTIDIPRGRIGHLVGEALMPDGEASALWGREMVIEPELIVRDSTGPPPNARR